MMAKIVADSLTNLPFIESIDLTDNRYGANRNATIAVAS